MATMICAVSLMVRAVIVLLLPSETSLSPEEGYTIKTSEELEKCMKENAAGDPSRWLDTELVRQFPFDDTDVKEHWERLSFPFPFFNSSTLNIRFSASGFVQLGMMDGGLPQQSMDRFLNSSWTMWPFYIAPYWTPLVYDYENLESSVIVQESKRSPTKDAGLILAVVKEAVQQYENGSSDFEPLLAYSVVWQYAKAATNAYSTDETATAALVLATDYQFSYAVMSWLSLFSNTDVAGGPEVVSGHSGRNGFIEITPEPMCRQVVPLFDEGKPTSDPLQCLRMMEETGLRDFYAPPCPCLERSIKVHIQFHPVATNGSEIHQCYEPLFSYKTWHLCCYDKNGMHVKKLIDSLLAVEKTSAMGSKAQDARNFCCKINSLSCVRFDWQHWSGSCNTGLDYEISSGGGYGSLHITTFAGLAFTFNGLGTYIILKEEKGPMELQAQTRRRGLGGATYFIAYTFKNLLDEASYQIYITDEGDLVHGWIQDVPERVAHLFSVEMPDRDTLVITTRRLRLKVEKISRDSLGHTLTMGYFESLHSAFIGLSVLSPHGPLTAEELEKFRVPPGDTPQPPHVTGPVQPADEGEGFESLLFLHMKSQDVLALFKDEEKKLKAQALCGQELFCLQEYYLFEDTDGAASTVLARSRRLDQEVAAGKLRPPKLWIEQASGDIDPQNLLPSQITKGMEMQLSGDFTVSDKIVLSMSGSVAEWENVALDGNTFQLAAAKLTTLRGLKYPQSLAFHARDTSTNFTATITPPVLLCLCEEDVQCGDLQSDFLDMDGDFTGNVGVVDCYCGRTSSRWPPLAGRFCERELDVCSDCYNRSACDPSKEVDYCGPCPRGMEGNGIFCRVKNFCGSDNGGCQYKCKNTVLGPECTCQRGFRAKGLLCQEINECSEDPHLCSSSGRYCVNIPGSYECRCKANGVGDNCVHAPYIYSGVVKLARPSVHHWYQADRWSSDKDLHNTLAQSLKSKLTTGSSSVGNADTLFVEVTEFDSFKSRVRRASGFKPAVEAQFIIRSSTRLSSAQLSSALSLSACRANCNMEGMIVNHPRLVQKRDLCSLASLNTCDPHTTACLMPASDLASCECLPGFEQTSDPTTCRDVNECAAKKHKCAADGDCSNTFGSYTCVCPGGQSWDAETEACVWVRSLYAFWRRS